MPPLPAACESVSIRSGRAAATDGGISLGSEQRADERDTMRQQRDFDHPSRLRRHAVTRAAKLKAPMARSWPKPKRWKVPRRRPQADRRGPSYRFAALSSSRSATSPLAGA